MKPFIFVSDFDGTITTKDFYWILLESFIGEEGIRHYREWKQSEKIGTAFLNKVFRWTHLSKEEHEKALDMVEVDPQLASVIEYVRRKNGDFAILSAGFDYYIKKALDKEGLHDIDLYTNPGVFEDGFFEMRPDKKSPFYSPVYGIDKGKVLTVIQQDYETVCFAGDSEPDIHAARHADLVFAKNELAHLMEEQGLEYVHYDSFADILRYLEQQE